MGDHEVVLEVDANDVPLGLRLREDFHMYNIYHRSAVLLLFNDMHEILLQKRAITKKRYPGMYDFAVSGTVNDETYEECIIREMQEELGILVPCTCAFKMTPFEKNDKAFQAVYIAYTTKDAFNISDELESTVRMPVKDLEEYMVRNPEIFTPHLRIGFQKYLAWSQ